MTAQAFSTADREALCSRIDRLLQHSRFRPALVEVQRLPHWEADPKALHQLGLVLHRFAPHAKDGPCAYSFARAMYRTAATRSSDPRLRADAIAHIAATYFEQGRLDDAIDAFGASLSLAPDHVAARLGLLAVACARHDLAQIRRSSQDLIDHIPDWDLDPEIVTALASAPEFAFLRSSRELFFDGFGGFPEQLQAVHDRQRLDNLEAALDLLSTDEPISVEDEPENTDVVRRALSLVDPILQSGQCTMPGVPVGSLQARLGL